MMQETKNYIYRCIIHRDFGVEYIMAGTSLAIDDSMEGAAKATPAEALG